MDGPVDGGTSSGPVDGDTSFGVVDCDTSFGAVEVGAASEHAARRARETKEVKRILTSARALERMFNILRGWLGAYGWL